MAGIGNDPLSYFWGNAKPDSPLSYEALQTRRKIAESLMGKRSPFPKNLGEGLTYAGEAIGDILALRSLDEKDREQGAVESRIRGGAPSDPYSASYVPPPTATSSSVTPPPAARTSALTPATTAPPSRMAAAPAEPAIYDEGDFNPLDAAAASGPGPRFRTERNAEVGGHVGFDRAVSGLHPEMQARLMAAYNAMPENIRHTMVLNEGKRTPEYQRFLYNTRSGRGPVAPPGGSKHEYGEAVDVDRGPALDWLQANAGKYGLSGIGRGDYPHIQMARGGRLFADPNNPVRLPVPIPPDAPTGRNGITRALMPGSATPTPSEPAPTGAMPGAMPDNITPDEEAATPAPYRVASLGNGAVSDAGPEVPGVPPASVPPVPPAGATAQAALPPNPAIATDIQPAPNMFSPVPLAQAAPGGFAPATPGTPQPAPRVLGPAVPDTGAIKPAPDFVLPSEEAIPPATPQEMKPPGPEPSKLPPRYGPSPAMQYWSQYVNNPRYSPGMQRDAERRYNLADQNRKETQAAAQEAWKNERERWEKHSDKYDDFVRTKVDRDIKQLGDRQGIEKTRAEIAKLYRDAGIPYQQSIVKADLDIAKARREVRAPTEHAVQGTIIQQRFDDQGNPTGEYRIAPGAPGYKEENLTEKQQSAVEFLVASAPNLDKIKNLNNGKALTYFKDDVLIDSPLVPNKIGNMLLSDAYRESKIAIGQWASLMLKHMSGAAVSPSEAMRSLPAYIPQAGDTDADIAAKAAQRDQLMFAIKAGAGTNAQKIVDTANEGWLKRKEDEQGRLPPVQLKSADEYNQLQPGRVYYPPDGGPPRVKPREQAK